MLNLDVLENFCHCANISVIFVELPGIVVGILLSQTAEDGSTFLLHNIGAISPLPLSIKIFNQNYMLRNRTQAKVLRSSSPHIQTSDYHANFQSKSSVLPSRC